MKEELQGELVEILTSIQTAAGKAGEFAMEQLPDIAQSYVMYGRASYTAGFALGVLLLIACATLFWWSHRVDARGDLAYERAQAAHAEKAKKSSVGYVSGEPRRYEFGTGEGFRMACVPTGMLGALITAFTANGLFLVWFAPKVWLLKEIATLLK